MLQFDTFIGTTSLSCISLFTSFYPQTSQTSHQQCYSFFALIVNHKIRNWIEFSQLLFLICNSVIALHWSRLKRHSNQSWDTSYTAKKPNAAAKSMFMICIGICRERSTTKTSLLYFHSTLLLLFYEICRDQSTYRPLNSLFGASFKPAFDRLDVRSSLANWLI